MFRFIFLLYDAAIDLFTNSIEITCAHLQWWNSFRNGMNVNQSKSMRISFEIDYFEFHFQLIQMKNLLQVNQTFTTSYLHRSSENFHLNKLHLKAYFIFRKLFCCARFNKFYYFFNWFFFYLQRFSIFCIFRFSSLSFQVCVINNPKIYAVDWNR